MGTKSILDRVPRAMAASSSVMNTHTTDDTLAPESVAKAAILAADKDFEKHQEVHGDVSSAVEAKSLLNDFAATHVKNVYQGQASNSSNWSKSIEEANRHAQEGITRAGDQVFPNATK